MRDKRETFRFDRRNIGNAGIGAVADAWTGRSQLAHHLTRSDHFWETVDQLVDVKRGDAPERDEIRLRFARSEQRQAARDYWREVAERPLSERREARVAALGTRPGRVRQDDPALDHERRYEVALADAARPYGRGRRRLRELIAELFDVAVKATIEQLNAGRDPGDYSDDQHVRRVAAQRVTQRLTAATFFPDEDCPPRRMPKGSIAAKLELGAELIVARGAESCVLCGTPLGHNLRYESIDGRFSWNDYCGDCRAEGGIDEALNDQAIRAVAEYLCR